MTGTGKIGKSYGKYGSNPNRIKSIRITEEQESNWNPDSIRTFLEGNTKSNDSIRINPLKDYLRGLYDIMENKFELKTDFTPGELETLLKIEEIIGR